MVENIEVSYNVIQHGSPSYCLTTDASLAGWGAVFQEIKTGGRWSELEKQLHINTLELKAVLFGLKSFCSNLKDCPLRVRIDNSTAVCYINNMGGTVSTACNLISKEIWSWCIAKGIWLSAAHLPGSKNVLADQASRQFNDTTEWMLDKSVFCKLTEIWGEPQLDIFASRLNTQCKNYISWKPDPGALFIDAFTINWSHSKNYLSPPFTLVNRCLQKIALEGVKAIIVVPLWPNQTWFSLLMQMVFHQPLILPRNCLSLPGKASAVPPTNLWLVACFVTGSNLESKVFQMRLPESLPAAGNELYMPSHLP